MNKLNQEHYPEIKFKREFEIKGSRFSGAKKYSAPLWNP